MIETTPIPNSKEVMAPFGNSGVMIRGERVHVKVVYSKLEGQMLRSVRSALVGLIVPTIFTKKQIARHDPEYAKMIADGSRIAYVGDLSEALDQAGKSESAALLRMEFKRMAGEKLWHRAFWSFEEGDCEVQRHN